MSAWKPLLAGDEQAAALSLAGEIVHAVAAWPIEPNDARFDGHPSAALLLAYASTAGLGDELGERAQDHLERAAAGMAGRNPLGLWTGIGGTAFSLAHLAGEEAEELHAGYDAALLDELAVEHWPRAYDLIGGLVGYGVVALERIEGGVAADGAKRVIARVIDHLVTLAERTGDAITWFTPPEQLPPHQRVTSPDGYYNAGLAHGVPGVIALLARLIAADLEVERARPLLDGAMTWLRSIPRAGDESRFPPMRARDGSTAASCRLAWCYGDAGIVPAMLAAARATGNSTWEAEARQYASAMAARSEASSGVVDAGLCHGAAGLLHIFNRLHQATGDRALADAARRWLAWLVAWRKPGSDVAGFPALLHDQQRADPGVLTGAAGIALALLAAATDVEPDWDRALLVNV